MRSNKFNIHWQVVRASAKSIKDVDSKILYVLNFLNSNKNIHNLDRVENWLKMTAVAYKDENRHKFELALEEINLNRDEFCSGEDMNNDLSGYTRTELEMVFNDLSKRKYGFQYKKIPQAHIDFINRLEIFLKKSDFSCGNIDG